MFHRESYANPGACSNLHHNAIRNLTQWMPTQTLNPNHKPKPNHNYFLSTYGGGEISLTPGQNWVTRQDVQKSNFIAFSQNLQETVFQISISHYFTFLEVIVTRALQDNPTRQMLPREWLSVVQLWEILNFSRVAKRYPILQFGSKTESIDVRDTLDSSTHAPRCPEQGFEKFSSYPVLPRTQRYTTSSTLQDAQKNL